jgi:hypothetical protein
MKQEKRNESKAESQKEQGIEEAVALINQTLNWIYSDVIRCRINAISVILPTGKGTQHLGRDGPPGRARSPGSNFLYRMHPVSSLLSEQVEEKSIIKMNINILIQTKIQFITNINYLKS